MKIASENWKTMAICTTLIICTMVFSYAYYLTNSNVTASHEENIQDTTEQESYSNIINLGYGNNGVVLFDKATGYFIYFKAGDNGVVNTYKYNIGQSYDIYSIRSPYSPYVDRSDEGS